MTTFRFDDQLRSATTKHLGGFELRRRADTGGLKRAAVDQNGHRANGGHRSGNEQDEDGEAKRP